VAKKLKMEKEIIYKIRENHLIRGKKIKKWKKK